MIKHIIATNSCHSQQLIRATDTANLQLMVANSKKDFAERLNEACSSTTPAIADGRGRRAELRRRVIAVGLTKVSGESVRKWLSGESIPSMDNIRFVATALKVNADWLLTGRPEPYARAADSTARSLSMESPTNVIFGQFNPAISEVIALMQDLGDDEQRDIVGAARVIHGQARLNKQNSKKLAGQ
jgi:transcriptional regulator with XRE-family HTH domain